jgi:hypothetical protein
MHVKVSEVKKDYKWIIITFWKRFRSGTFIKNNEYRRA